MNEAKHQALMRRLLDLHEKLPVYSASELKEAGDSLLEIADPVHLSEAVPVLMASRRKSLLLLKAFDGLLLRADEGFDPTSEMRASHHRHRYSEADLRSPSGLFQGLSLDCGRSSQIPSQGFIRPRASPDVVKLSPNSLVASERVLLVAPPPGLHLPSASPDIAAGDAPKRMSTTAAAAPPETHHNIASASTGLPEENHQIHRPRSRSVTELHFCHHSIISSPELPAVIPSPPHFMEDDDQSRTSPPSHPTGTHSSTLAHPPFQDTYSNPRPIWCHPEDGVRAGLVPDVDMSRRGEHLVGSAGRQTNMRTWTAPASSLAHSLSQLTDGLDLASEGIEHVALGEAGGSDSTRSLHTWISSGPFAPAEGHRRASALATEPHYLHDRLAQSAGSLVVRTAHFEEGAPDHSASHNDECAHLPWPLVWDPETDSNSNCDASETEAHVDRQRSRSISTDAHDPAAYGRKHWMAPASGPSIDASDALFDGSGAEWNSAAWTFALGVPADAPTEAKCFSPSTPAITDSTASQTPHSLMSQSSPAGAVSQIAHALDDTALAFQRHRRITTRTMPGRVRQLTTVNEAVNPMSSTWDVWESLDRESCSSNTGVSLHHGDATNTSLNDLSPGTAAVRNILHECARFASQSSEADWESVPPPVDVVGVISKDGWTPFERRRSKARTLPAPRLPKNDNPDLKKFTARSETSGESSSFASDQDDTLVVKRRAASAKGRESMELSLADLPDGSLVDLHALGKCKPCAFFYNRKKGCRNGESCEFCHHEDHAKLTLKQWKKLQQRVVKTSAREQLEDDDIALNAVDMASTVDQLASLLPDAPIAEAASLSRGGRGTKALQDDGNAKTVPSRFSNIRMTPEKALGPASSSIDHFGFPGSHRSTTRISQLAGLQHHPRLIYNPNIDCCSSSSNSHSQDVVYELATTSSTQRPKSRPPGFVPPGGVGMPQAPTVVIPSISPLRSTEIRTPHSQFTSHAGGGLPPTMMNQYVQNLRLPFRATESQLPPPSSASVSRPPIAHSYFPPARSTTQQQHTTTTAATTTTGSITTTMMTTPQPPGQLTQNADAPPLGYPAAAIGSRLAGSPFDAGIGS